MPLLRSATANTRSYYPLFPNVVFSITIKYPLPNIYQTWTPSNVFVGPKKKKKKRKQDIWNLESLVEHLKNRSKSCKVRRSKIPKILFVRSSYENTCNLTELSDLMEKSKKLWFETRSQLADRKRIEIEKFAIPFTI